jgi:hypothetical protein
LSLFQANSKFSQIQQNLAKPEQNPSKKKAWISLDSLVRIEPFQWVAPTPRAKKFFSRSFPGRRPSNDRPLHFATTAG